MLKPPSLAPLVPVEHPLPNGNTLYCFQNNTLELVKLDFTVEAGSCYQFFKCQAHAANQLFAEATDFHDARQLAEFLDFRGIVVERLVDVCVSNISFYFLHRYADELFPMIREMFDFPRVTRPLFDAYLSKRRQQLSIGFQRTTYLAHNKFYELLYGSQHPLGTYAKPSDVDLLTMEAVSDFLHQRYSLASAHIVLSGYIDDGLLSLADQYLAPMSADSSPRFAMPTPMPSSVGQYTANCPIANAVQSSLRIGRILTLPWYSEDYARFMVLNTVLGGYFGSRLMSNIREDKGYTYGIYSTTQIHRDSIIFFISADVSVEATQPAIDEIFKEIQRLQHEPVSGVELERVRNYMMGDFIRSIDGAFELSERYRQMVATSLDEQFSTHLIEAIMTVTPQQLMHLAQTHMTDLLTVTAGQPN